VVRFNLGNMEPAFLNDLSCLAKSMTSREPASAGGIG
jgi:hypothetical protein